MVWIESFPEPGVKIQVSIGDGMMPRWNPDNSKELLFVSSPGGTPTLMSVAINASGSALTVGAPVPLFRQGVRNLNFSVSSGRFLLHVAPSTTDARGNLSRAQTPSAGTTTGIHIILNWPAVFAPAN